MTVVKSISLPPESLRKQALQDLMDRDVEPSPENLLRRCADPDAPLHDYFAKTPEEAWAAFGKYQTARQIIRTTHVEYKVGGKTISHRMVEVVRAGGAEKYAPLRDILADASMRDAYLEQTMGLLEQAQGKLTRLRALLREDSADAA